MNRLWIWAPLVLLVGLTGCAQGPRIIGFEALDSYEYPWPTPQDETPSQERQKQIPLWIQKLDQTHVTIEGYQLPVDRDGENLTAFYLSSEMFGCCNPDWPPRLTQIVESDVVAEGGVPHFPHTRVKVTGLFTVGESIDEGGINSIYQLKVHAVDSEGREPDLVHEQAERHPHDHDGDGHPDH